VNSGRSYPLAAFGFVLICEFKVIVPNRPLVAHLYGPAAFHNGFGAVTEVAHMYPAY